MIKSNKKTFRSRLTILLGAFFVASAFIFNIGTAQMQAGANTIVFERYDSTLRRTKIFVMNADGTNVMELADGFDPSWSGNGAKIAYAYGDFETYDIWTMNADGTNKTQLTGNYRSYSPAWSPDGSKVAFVSDHEGGYHVYVINADGTNQQRINITLSEITQEYAPAWLPDSSKVIFLGQKVVNGLARNDYYATDLAGAGTTTQLTDISAVLEQDPAAVSADGSQIVFRHQFGLRAFSTDGSFQSTVLTNSSPDREADYAPGGSKIVFRRNEMLSVIDADGSNFINLDVVGSNPDWNPTAVIQTPTPTPTVTPTPQITADLSVQANVSVQTVTVGQQATYTVNVQNSGANAATGVALTNDFSPNLTLVSIGSSQGSCALTNGQINCQLGTLDVNAAATVTIVASPNALGFIANQFTASAIETDPNSQNNSATANITAVGVCAQPFDRPYGVTKLDWRRDERNAQDTLVLTLRNITNENLDPRLILVFDNLPQDVTIDSRSIAGYTQCAAPLSSPYVVAYAPNQKEWKPMQTITFVIPFNNPSRAGIAYDLRLYTGSVNP